MKTDTEVITLYAVAVTRTHLAAIETNLMAIDGDIAPRTGEPILGSVDLDFLTLCQAQSHLSSLRADQIGAIAGPAVATAIEGYQAAFRDMHDAYGLACGPDRSRAERDALHETLRAVASNALGHLTVYATQTRDLPVPDRELYVQALQRRPFAPGTATVAAPRSPTPRVRIPLTRDQVARRARIALGYAFGGLGGVCLMMLGKPTRYSGMIALMHLSGLVEHVGARASSLSRRCPPEHSVFADHAQGISDNLDALFHRCEDAIIVRQVAPEAIAPMTEDLKPVIVRIRDAIRQVEALGRVTA